jgi:DNA-binding IclR family transcriptional regulator
LRDVQLKLQFLEPVVTTLASAAAVLRCFAPERPELTVTDVAALTAMPKSSVSRLLRAMRDAGLLEAVGTSKHFRPGALVFEVGRLFRSASSLVARADAVVAELSVAFGHTGYVSVRDGRDVVGVTHHPGAGALRVVTPVGHRLAGFASATGRTLLARLSDEEVRALHPGALQPPSPTAPQSLDELLARLAQVRRDGYAVSHDEANRGVTAVAVAVADAESGEEASLCIAYPTSAVTPAERRAIVERMLDGAAQITGAGSRG